jgi:pseudaminic acid synthase
MNSSIIIQNQSLGPEHAPWVIAEMSANHNGSLERALKIIESAALSGATAVKLQTYTPQSMTLDLQKEGFVINHPKSLWYQRSLFDLYAEAQTPYEWHKILFDYCKKFNIIGFSSPFDPYAVEFLESLEVPCYKIASLELNDYALLESVARTGKPVFVSTGTSTLQEVEEAFDYLKTHKSGPIIILKCTSGYPTPFEESNLNTLKHLKNHFGPLIGLSDHTTGTAAAIAAVALGACAIEKHFTLDRNDGGVDASFSLEPQEFAALSRETKNAWSALGEVWYGSCPSEKPSVGLRRSLYVVQDVHKGQKVNCDRVRAIRPGSGLSPKYLKEIKDQTFSQDVDAGTPLSWNQLENNKVSLKKLKAASVPIIAIVQARMNSSRLPGKVLMSLAGTSVLEHVIERLKRVKSIDAIVIATTQEEADSLIEHQAIKLGVSCLRGSSEDVLSRYYKAAEAYQAKIVVRITADCPLLDSDLIEAMIEDYQLNCSQLDYLSNTIDRTYPRGLDIEIFSIHALRDMQERALNPLDREHVTRLIHQDPRRYVCKSFKQEKDLSFHRWTLDTPLDYLYLAQIYSQLLPKNRQFSTQEVLDWVKENPSWALMNSIVLQKKD